MTFTERNVMDNVIFIFILFIEMEKSLVDHFW